jgi:hypothetical protein
MRLLIDPPGPFAPASKIRAFLASTKDLPQDDPVMVAALRQARLDLKKAERRESRRPAAGSRRSRRRP